MIKRSHIYSILAGLMVTTPFLLRAQEAVVEKQIKHDPPPSLIVNNSDARWALRISDDVAPMGIVKVTEVEGDNPVKTFEFQAKDSRYVIFPHSKVQFVICGSSLEATNPIIDKLFKKVPQDQINTLKHRLIALYLSLDKLTTGDQIADKGKSVSRYHFFHGVLADNPKVPASEMAKDCAWLHLKPEVMTFLQQGLDPVTDANAVGASVTGVLAGLKNIAGYGKSNSKNITANIDHYQHEEGGAFWTIEN